MRLTLRLLPVLWLQTTGAIAKAANQACYYPDGSLVGDFPCFPEQDVSMCCGANHTCMDNGMCRWPDNAMPGQMIYVRGSCTDRQWNSAQCPEHCTSFNPWVPFVADCQDGQYCCAANPNSAISGACCKQQFSDQYLFPATTGTTVTVIGASGYSKAGSPTTGPGVSGGGSAGGQPSVGVPPNGTGTASSSSSSSTSPALAIGLGAGLGGALFLVLVAAAVFLCLHRRKSRNGGPPQGSLTQGVPYIKQPAELGTHHRYSNPVELHG